MTRSVEKEGYEFTETFVSKTDADAWQTMVETTLAHAEKIDFDVSIYASGLATSVREYGSLFPMDRWLKLEVPRELGIKGLPVAIVTADGYIAAIAAANGFAVATRDAGPFSTAGVAVINPWQA